MALNGQTAVVFGGSSGMGKGAAKHVVLLGGRVVLAARDKAKLEAARSYVNPADPGAVGIAEVDASDEDAVKAYFASVHPGSIKHLAITVGPSVADGPITDVNLAKAKQQFDLKFFSAVNVAKYGAPVLADGGSITFCSGALSRRPGKGSAMLACCNAALEALARALAGDLGPRLRVNCVSPGLVATEMWDGMPPAALEGMLKGFGASVPAGRAGTIDDVGSAIAYIMTNGWITGTTLDVDGGAVIR